MTSFNIEIRSTARFRRRSLSLFSLDDTSNTLTNFEDFLKRISAAHMMTPTMKTLICSLAVIVSVALSNAVFAADVKEQQMTGTVVECPFGYLTIENSKKEQIMFNLGELGDQRYQPKVGDRVTVYYDISQRDHLGRPIVHKIEKLGKAEKGSRKH